MSILIKKKKERKNSNPFGKGQLNLTNTQAVDWLKGVHPSLAKHIWQRNGLVQAIAMERFGGVDLLGLPVCEKCEKPGAWHDNDSCECFSCGHNTPKNKTKTLYRYIAEDSMPHGMKQSDMDMLQKILMPTMSGAIQEMIDSIDNLENNEYKPDENEKDMPVDETIIEEIIDEDDESEEQEDETIETDTNDSTVSDGEA